MVLLERCPMKSDGCGRSMTLAHVPGYRVDHCSCGLVHVCVGPVTVHMEPAAFVTFSEVIACSAEQILEPETKPHSILSLVHGLRSDVAES
jgi:hypothetical protein